MKNLKLFSILTAITLVVGLCFTSCQKNEAPEAQTKKVTFGFNAQIPDNTNKKVEDTDPYYGATACDFTGLAGATVNVEYTYNEVKYIETLEILNNPAVDKFVATELIQVEIPGDAGSTEAQTITVTKFNIEVDGDIVMAIPELNSAYDGYVDTPTSFNITVTEYDKKYVDLEVLCFQPDDYLEFGFTWFDFDIVEGEVISVFFNCINSEDREGYHEVLPANVKAYEGIYEDGDLAYFDKLNYTVGVPLEDLEPLNVEVPGLYKEYDDDEKANGNDHSTDVVMTLGVTPNGYYEQILIPITKAEVDKYIASPSVANGWEIAKGAVKYPENNGDDRYDYAFVYGEDKGEKVIHYQLQDCYKAEYYLTDSDNKHSTIFAVWPTDGVDVENGVVLAELFTISNETQEGIPSGVDVHIGLSNDKRKLIATNSFNSNKLYVYDIYSLEYKEFDFEPAGGSMYMFSELVYGKISTGEYKLYATCKGSSNVKLLEFDIDSDVTNPKFTYTYTYDFKDEEGNPVMSTLLAGGDLVIDNQGRLLCVSANSGMLVIDDDLADNPENGNETLDPADIKVISGLTGVTGATMTKKGNIITSHTNTNRFSIWDWNGTTMTKIGNDIVPTPLPGLDWGDMASIYAGIQE